MPPLCHKSQLFHAPNWWHWKQNRTPQPRPPQPRPPLTHIWRAVCVKTIFGVKDRFWGDESFSRRRFSFRGDVNLVALNPRLVPLRSFRRLINNPSRRKSSPRKKNRRYERRIVAPKIYSSLRKRFVAKITEVYREDTNGAPYTHRPQPASRIDKPSPWYILVF